MKRRVNNIITTGHIINRKGIGVKEASSNLVWLKLGMLGVGMMMVYALAKGAWELQEGFGRITEARSLYEEELKRNESLNYKFQQVQGEDYLERVAREKLNMQKEGETVILLPGGLPEMAKTEAKAETVESEQVYQKWLKLLW